MKSFAFFISIKKILKQKRLKTCLILIALVVIPLVCAVSFSESMMSGIADKYIYLSGGHIKVFSENLPEEIKALSNSIEKSVQGTGMLYSSTSYVPLTLKGIEEGYFNRERSQFIDINLSDQEDLPQNGILISKNTAEKLSLHIGDKAAVMIVPDNSKSVIRPILVKIIGIYTTGYEAFDTAYAFCNYSYCKNLFPESSFTEIILDKQHRDQLDNLGTVLNGLNYTKWTDENALMYQNFVTSRQMISIILFVIVFIAAFYTASTAQQVIQDDMQQLAILKLIGTSDKQIRKICFISVYIVTCLGMVAGLVIGISISYLFRPVLKALSHSSIKAFSYYLLDFEIYIPYKSVAVILLSLLVISAVAVRLSLYKTRRISPLQLFNQKW